MRRLFDFFRGVIGLGLILALLVGIPALLVLTVGNPLPTEIPPVDVVRAHITDGDIPDPFLIKTLAVVVWFVWDPTGNGHGGGAGCGGRGRMAGRAPVLPGVQLLAGKLVASAMLIISAFGPTRAASVAPIVAPVVSVDLPFDAELEGSRSAEMPRVGGRAAAPVAAGGSMTPAATAGADAAAVSSRPAVLPGAFYTVTNGDNWWDLAERLLGDGLRWSELRAVNAGRTMPNGDVVTDRTESVRPGWVLAVPLDADPDHLDPAPPEGDGRSPADVLRPELLVYEGPTGGPLVGQGPAYQVVEGDTLWDIADRHLGDPFRWPEIFEASTDLTQTFGLQITDPNLIWPDSILVLPADAVDVPTPAPELVAEVLGRAPVPAPPVLPTPAPPTHPDAGGPTDQGRTAIDPDDLQRMAARAAELAEAENGAESAAAGANGAGPDPGRPSDPDPGAPDPGPGSGADLPADAATDQAAVAALALGAGSLLVATGLLGLLRRARRLRLAEIGEGSVPQPPPLELAEIETVLRNRADPGAATDLVGAVASLIPPTSRVDEPVAVPEVVRVAGGRIEAVVHDPGAEFPDPWREVPVDGGVLPPGRRAVAAELSELAGADGGRAGDGSPDPIVPTLVTVGVGLHLNLEAIGVVAVDGDGESASALARAMVHELACGPAVRPGSTLLAPSPELGPPTRILVSDRLGGVEMHPAVRSGPLTRLLPEARSWLDEVDLGLTAAGASTPWALRRPDQPAPRPAALVVLAHGADLVEGGPLAELVERARDRRLPVAVVLVGSPALTSLRPSMTVVASQGRVRLEPLGLGAVAGDLGLDAILGVEALIDHARRAPLVPRPDPTWAMAEAVEAGDRLPTGALQPPRRDRDDTDPAQAPTEETPEHEIATELPPDDDEITDRSDDDDRGLLIRVLGPVEIEGGPDDLTEPQRSILAFLALAGPSTAEQIGQAVWPGGEADGGELDAALADLGRRLGPLFPAAGDGRHRVRSTITDLGAARRWIAQAQGLSDDRARNLLQLALTEVRGRPFAEVPARHWQWCEDHRLAIATQATSLLIDACFDLCDGAYQADDIHLALWACEVASRLDPLQETTVTRQVQLLAILERHDDASAVVDDWEQAFARSAGRPAPRGPRSALAAQPSTPSDVEQAVPHVG